MRIVATNGKGASIIIAEARMLLLGRSQIRFEEMLEELRRRHAEPDGFVSGIWEKIGWSQQELGQIAGGDHNFVALLTAPNPTSFQVGCTWSSDGERHGFEVAQEKLLTLRLFTLDHRPLERAEHSKLERAAVDYLLTLAEMGGAFMTTITIDGKEMVYQAERGVDRAVLAEVDMKPETVADINRQRLDDKMSALRQMLSAFGGGKFAEDMLRDMAKDEDVET